MWRQGQNLLRRTAHQLQLHLAASSSSPSLSIWRRKKEMGKEGLMVAKELKRLQHNPVRFERFMKTNVSRLLKSDLVAVLVEFQRQNLVPLSMKNRPLSGSSALVQFVRWSKSLQWTAPLQRIHGRINLDEMRSLSSSYCTITLYNVVRRETWYRPDMFFYRDMLMMLARNISVDEARMVWDDLKREEVHFDQHTFGDLIRAFLDSGLPDEAMRIYDEMRCCPDTPLSLPYRVILKGLIPYPELREKVKDDFVELFPDVIVYDPPEDLFSERTESEED
ncbi:hypothetical protein ACS0TY_026923 [Phlomoides rotata]